MMFLKTVLFALSFCGAFMWASDDQGLNHLSLARSRELADRILFEAQSSQSEDPLRAIVKLALELQEILGVQDRDEELPIMRRQSTQEFVSETIPEALDVQGWIVRFDSGKIEEVNAAWDKLTLADQMKLAGLLLEREKKIVNGTKEDLGFLKMLVDKLNKLNLEGIFIIKGQLLFYSYGEKYEVTIVQNRVERTEVRSRIKSKELVEFGTLQ